jgi:WASH complex subunit 7
MKILAKDNLGLNLFDSFLPMGCLDQGMDLLEIMRNIDLFVTQYSYNMNMQQFIEFRPNMTASTKHLHTLTIRSIPLSEIQSFQSIFI